MMRMRAQGYLRLRVWALGATVLLLAGCHLEQGAPDPKVRELLWDIQRAQQGNNYTGTLALVDSALAIVPHYPSLYFTRGRLLSKLYRFDEAQAAFEQALDLDPGYIGAAYHLGNNAFFVGRNRDALRYYWQEHARITGNFPKPAQASVLLQLGRVYARLGIADSARWAYEESLAVQENNAQAWAWLAELSEDAGRLEDALGEVRRAFALEPENIEHQYLVGALGFRMGELEEAEGHLRGVVNQAPWHAGAHYNLGRCLLALGREAEAVPFLAATDSLQELQANIILAKFAVERNPANRGHWLELASLYIQTGQQKEAREALVVARQLGS